MQRRSTYTRGATLLFVPGTGLWQGHALVQRREVAPRLDAEQTELTAVLRQIDADLTLAGRDAAARDCADLVDDTGCDFGGEQPARVAYTAGIQQALPVAPHSGRPSRTR